MNIDAAGLFDMVGYLKKISVYDKYVARYPPEPSEDVLNDLVSGHVTNIPYQNYDLFKSVETSDLSAHALFKKLVVDNRGGMCYENSELLYHVLSRLGFDAKRVPCCVLNNLPYVSSRPPNHNIIVVNINRKTMLIDVGFGYNSLRRPIEFTFDATEEKTVLESERYQLLCHPGSYQLNMWLKGAWASCYRFDRPLRFVDAEETRNLYRTMLSFPGLMPIRDIAVKIGIVTADGRVGFNCNCDEEAVFQQIEIRENSTPKSTVIDCADFCAKIKSIVNLDIDAHNNKLGWLGCYFSVSDWPLSLGRCQPIFSYSSAKISTARRAL